MGDIMTPTWYINAALVLLEFWGFFLLMDTFFQRKQSAAFLGGAACISAVFILLFDLLFGAHLWSKGLFFAVFWLDIALLYEGKQSKKIICISAYFVCLYLLDVSTMIAVQITFKVSMLEVLQNDLLFGLMALFSKIFLLLLVYFLAKVHRTRREISIPMRTLLMPAIVLLLSCCVMLACVKLAIETDSISATGMLAILSGIVLVDWMAISQVGWIEKSISEKSQRQLLEQKQKVQIESMEALQEAYMLQRKNAHEFNRHITLLSELAEQGNLDQIKQYLVAIQRDQTKRVLAINTHNMIIDTVFNRYYYEAQKKEIDMNFVVNDFSDFYMPPEELSVLLSNLLENAVEACEYVKNAPKIQVQMIYNAQKNEVFLSIRNTSMPVKIENGKIESIKKIPYEHGYGLSNVRELLNKYHAEPMYRYKDGWFQFTTLFSI